MAKNILILSTDYGVEKPEIVQPLETLRADGHTVTVATPGGGDVQTVTDDRNPDVTVPTDTALADVTGEFDVIVLPGGTVNADTARADEGIRDIVSAQAKAGRTVAAICHAPWVLVDTELAKGKNLTSFSSIRPDLVNAGATWHDEEVVVCDTDGWRLITSRNPGDLDAFIAAIEKD
ncbi:protease [Corynebacterium bovis]|uniref:Protease n=3 Tax=Corynebacterium bovis TaxID=36808 RepID=A0A3R8QKI8_9CORY|nr:protease [Corynebacterium bovis]MBB3116789.1 protease I [Corynebacterium bovis DSM 20582 = CIP 54.80]MDK8511218.1 protease [Corynebacterium bovis]QQC46738.1 protease [Corynebacterium bovis]RRO79965.1 protease [Corynebacterium bovis]RRO80636.1 protease [Corynebacterium bovis]